MSTGDTENGDILQRLRARGGARKRPDCPNEERLRMLAVGLADPKEAEELLAHAAACDWCGAVLREAAQDLVEEPTDEELAFARSTKLADARNRREMAERLAGEAPRAIPTLWARAAAWLDHAAHWMRRPVAWLVPAGVAAAAGLVFLVPTYFPSTEHLLAQAYFERRTSEFRFAGAQHAPIRQEMGEESAFRQPEPLLKAQAKLAAQLRSNPDAPDTLRLQGEANLISSHASAAIEMLEKARSLRPQDARILADLGAAYALRGETEQQPADYHTSINLLSQSLQLRPGIAEVLFNRALVLEKMELFAQAVAAWEDYLKVDSAGEWAGEARKRLAESKDKLHHPSAGMIPAVRSAYRCHWPQIGVGLARPAAAGRAPDPST